ncbi:phage major capsid protein [Melissococcus plutonius]|uniref:phage major capsid protein n=1 Tax=Melissococcus plutonius TaxID=33970 RepID=UPI003C30116D
MPNINKINDAWIASGQKVADLNDKLNNALIDNDINEEEFTNLKKERDDEMNRRDNLKEQLDIARAEEVINMDESKVEKLDQSQENLKEKFISDFKGMMRNDPQIMNIMTSSTDESGNAIGLTIPQDIQTTINTLVRQFNALQQYVNVESVSTTNGSRVYEVWSDITPLQNLDDEEKEIGDNDDPKLHLVKYLIHRYAGISTITNSLLKDTADNLLAWLSTWIAKKVVVTRNQAILKEMNAVPKKPTIAKFDDIKDLINTSVDPAIATTSILMTNVSGFNIISKVKDNEGRYLVQPVVTNPDIKQIDGKQIIVIADRWLPNVGTKDAPAYPLYYGDLKQAITLFDREQMSLLTTNIGGGAFEKDQTKIRVIDRFDVEPTDTEAFVAGSFVSIADQVTPSK